MNPLDWSLIGGPLPVILLIAGLLGATWLAAGRSAPGRGPGAGRGNVLARIAGHGQDRRWLLLWVPLVALLMAVLVGATDWFVDNVWRPFPDLLPASVLIWAWAGLTAVVLALARQPVLRSWRRHVAALLAGAVMLLAAVNEINGYYLQYPSLRVALGPWLDPKPPFSKSGIVLTARLVAARQDQSLVTIWHPPGNMPKAGKIYQADIPGTVSGFRARPGYVYLPPAYLVAPRAELPVLVLLAGQPGDARAWVDTGRIQAMMDAFAGKHNGLAPVVVMPDDLGGELSNPLCLDSRLGHAQTYLTVDVPAWISSHLEVRPAAKGWAIAGFSDGGTCALQLATQAPHVYPVFIDISGQRAPSLGNPVLTVRKAFGGNTTAFARVNPVDVMTRSRFPGDVGMFVSGSDDRVYTPQQRLVYEKAQLAGMRVEFMVLAGGHNWRVWRAGLAQNVGWLSDQLGITQRPAVGVRKPTAHSARPHGAGAHGGRHHAGGRR
jgi:S-formylglutathione hydrolase FrmB